MKEIALRLTLPGPPPPAGTAVLVEAFDRYDTAPIDAEAGVMGSGSVIDAGVGRRADLVLDGTPSGQVNLKLKAIDGYRIQRWYRVKATVGASVYEVTVAPTCSTVVGAIAGYPDWSVITVTQLTYFGTDAALKSTFIGSLHRYGRGAAVSLTYDVQATGGTRMTDLLEDAVGHVRWQRSEPLLALEVVPLMLHLENQSPWPADVRVVEGSLPPGAVVFDAVDLPAQLALPAGVSLDLRYLLRLPDATGAAAGDFDLEVDGGSGFQPVGQAPYSLSVTQTRVGQADVAIAALDALLADPTLTPTQVTKATQARASVVTVRASTAGTRAAIVPVLWELHGAAQNLRWGGEGGVESASRIQLGHLVRMWEDYWYVSP